MAVVRVEKNSNYTVMSNVHLRDKRLSLKAKGLLSLILSLPEKWDYSVNGLVSIAREGRAGIMSSLKELEEAGYLTRHQLRGENGQMGKIGETDYGRADCGETDYGRADCGCTDCGRSNTIKYRRTNYRKTKYRA